MKRTIWECDLCGKQVKDNSENNFQVNLDTSGNTISNFTKTFDGIICEECAAKKSTQEILFAVAEEGKKATSLTKVASVTFKTLKVDNTLEGIQVKAVSVKPATEPNTKPLEETTIP